MRRLSLFAVLLLPILLSACKPPAAYGQASGRYDPFYSTAFSETQACAAGTCSRAADPVSTSEGASTISVDSYRVLVCAAAGQTLSGAGNILGWWCDSVSTLCFRFPSLDQAQTVSGKRCMGYDIKNPMISSNPDSVVAAASGVTVSGGAALTVRIYTHFERYK